MSAEDIKAFFDTWYQSGKIDLEELKAGVRFHRHEAKLLGDLEEYDVHKAFLGDLDMYDKASLDYDDFLDLMMGRECALLGLFLGDSRGKAQKLPSQGAEVSRAGRGSLQQEARKFPAGGGQSAGGQPREDTGR